MTQSQIAAVNSVEENVNANKMIQQNVNASTPPPRLHPKKRKFDLSELEDEQHNNQANTIVSSPIVPSSVTFSASSTILYPQHQNGNQQNATLNIGSYSNPNLNQIVKNTAEVQQIIKRQSFMNYR